MPEISGKLREYLMLALFAAIIIVTGTALGPTVEQAAYPLYVAANAANYTLHSVVALIAWLIPTGYYLAIVMGVFFVLIRAIKA